VTDVHGTLMMSRVDRMNGVGDVGSVTLRSDVL
jgi:hypothetical protein